MVALALGESAIATWPGPGDLVRNPVCLDPVSLTFLLLRWPGHVTGQVMVSLRLSLVSSLSAQLLFSWSGSCVETEAVQRATWTGPRAQRKRLRSYAFALARACLDLVFIM